MSGSEYRRWALDTLRTCAIERGIGVAGPKDRPHLTLAAGNGLRVGYQEQWWRSAFQRSGYGGALVVSLSGANEASDPVTVKLVNLYEEFVPLRSPQDLEGVVHFIGWLQDLAGWCTDQRAEELLAVLRQGAGPPSRLHGLVAILRDFSRA